MCPRCMNNCPPLFRTRRLNLPIYMLILNNTNKPQSPPPHWWLYYNCCQYGPGYLRVWGIGYSRCIHSVPALYHRLNWNLKSSVVDADHTNPWHNEPRSCRRIPNLCFRHMWFLCAPGTQGRLQYSTKMHNTVH